MTHAARQTAFETFKRRDREHNEVYRLTSGFREEHVIQNFAEIYHQVREELSERRGGGGRRRLQFTNLMNERGVIVTNLETLYDGFAMHGWSDQFEEYGHEQQDTSVDNQSRGSLREKFEQDDWMEFVQQSKKFPVEYVGFDDFRIAFSDIFTDNAGGHYYASNWDVEEQESAETWGIFIDLRLMEIQIKESLQPCFDEGRLCVYWFFFNVFHEHFHYLVELAAMRMASRNDRFELYRNYRKKTMWGDWYCKDPACCRISPEGVTQYKIDSGRIICGYPRHQHSHANSTVKIGYQYPFEETMANAYAVRMFNNLFKPDSRKDAYLDLIEEWIDCVLPIGYTEYRSFPMNDAYRLGERIMTRLLRGDYPVPEVNCLQHDLIDGKDISEIIVEEARLFVGEDLVENKLKNLTKSNFRQIFSEVPIHIIGCDEVPWLADFIKSLMKDNLR